jgi:Ca-activated chloride channel family protein
MQSRPLTIAISLALLTVAAGCSTPRSTPIEPGARGDGPATPVVVDELRQKENEDDRDRKVEEVGATAEAAKSEPVDGRALLQSEPAALAGSMQPVPVSMPYLAPPAPLVPGQYWEPANRENYADHDDNPVHRVAETPVSTFSIDVDTGAYSNARRMVENGALPPADAVRAEEFINWFDYAYAPPRSLDQPFSVTTEIAPAPWNAQRHLMLVGIKGYEVPKAGIPASNLVFLIDTSGSMQTPEKLPLVKESLKQLVPALRRQDRVTMVVYAGSAGLVLPPTAGDDHASILAAIDALEAGGSTNGGAGIDLAYKMAQRAFVEGGVNRVVLATDGDFNVGTVDIEALKTMVADKRKSGVALTTLGFGTENYNDELAEQLADIGNGNHAYIDSEAEARKVLVDEMSSTMLTIAKDVKIQIEFNPTVVAEYRLIGYENRMLRREDFANDKIDAGEIGAGHDVTALYELTLVGSKSNQIEPLRYGSDTSRPDARATELAFLRLRYKQPDAESSRLIERPIQRAEIAQTPGERLRFAAAVAAFADSLRGGTHLGGFDLQQVAALARDATGSDPAGYRAGFIRLVEQARALQTPADATAAVSK